MKVSTFIPCGSAVGTCITLSTVPLAIVHAQVGSRKRTMNISIISINKIDFCPWKPQGVFLSCWLESKGSQIPELTGPMQWPSDAPGSTGEAHGCAGE